MLQQATVKTNCSWLAEFWTNVGPSSPRNVLALVRNPGLFLVLDPQMLSQVPLLLKHHHHQLVSGKKQEVWQSLEQDDIPKSGVTTNRIKFKPGFTSRDSTAL